MRAIGVAVGMLALCGCQPAKNDAQRYIERENDTTLVNPPGRYQMIASPKGDGVFVLDTRMGNLRLCTASASSVSQISCAEPASAK